MTNPRGPVTVHPEALHHVLETLESTLPEEEVLHSLHWQALQDRTVPRGATTRFSQFDLQALHAKLAAAGFLRRLLSGDHTAETMHGLALNLMNALAAQAESSRALSELAQTPEGAGSPVVQTMRRVMAMADRAAGSVAQALHRTGLEPVLQAYATRVELPESRP